MALADALAQVVLTRPAGRNESLALALRQAGLSVLVAPALKIDWLDTPRPVPRAGDLHIFVSGQAVAAFFSGLTFPWPTGAWACAVGQATAQALQDYVPADCILAPAADAAPDSESLLAIIMALDLQPAQAHILRAGEGRDWLAAQLRQLGWQVHCHALYARHPCVWDEATCRQLCADDGLRILLLTSLDALAAIDASLRQHRLRWPSCLQAVTLHARIARRLQYLYADQPDHALRIALSPPQETALFQAIVAASRQPSRRIRTPS
ncbi:uroporphyrinogen-III synthase [Castellaniella sp.]|uniref:uroporphyrinogen-III synthase n=1 Tax=Castellaniella sp. TaxID=1955812 RepID=UPI002AFF9FA3|nr:uroporphyrinogen-III synthase [Castellaniella sp.]